MKKTIAFIVVLTLIIIPFSTTFAGTDADDEIITIEDIIDLFRLVILLIFCIILFFFF